MSGPPPPLRIATTTTIATAHTDGEGNTCSFTRSQVFDSESNSSTCTVGRTPIDTNRIYPLCHHEEAQGAFIDHMIH